MRSSLFWDVTQRRVIVIEVLEEAGLLDTCRWDPIGCPETSVTINLRCVTSQKNEAYRRAAQIPGDRSPWRLNFVLWRLMRVGPHATLMTLRILGFVVYPEYFILWGAFVMIIITG